ncbi:hypothetical protein AB0C95_22060 [Streptomyces caniferus]|uniref:hypothetical protein n=1 Tax=Streptomyces caniferus TaxID=285557 RepID=UPI00340F801A
MSTAESFYAADAPRPAPDAASVPPEEVFGRAVAHGNEHAIKFADTALDVAAASEDGNSRALSAVSAALNAVALIDQDE